MDTPDPNKTPSRKRPRDDEDDVEVDAGANQVKVDPDVMAPAAVRDKTYYKEDGDCVIQIGKVLFKARNIFHCYCTDIK